MLAAILMIVIHHTPRLLNMAAKLEMVCCSYLYVSQISSAMSLPCDIICCFPILTISEWIFASENTQTEINNYTQTKIDTHTGFYAKYLSNTCLTNANKTLKA